MIIAEIGQNFCGDMSLAEILITLAKQGGADLAKFQLFDSEKSPGYKGELIKSQLTKQQAKHLFEYGEKLGIEVFFSVFDTERIKWCEEIGVKRYKVATGMRDRTILNALWDTEKQLIISRRYGLEGTLIAFLNGKIETRRFINPGEPYDRVKTLICNPCYPSKLSDIGLSGIKFTKNYAIDDPIWFHPANGFSDHTIGLDACRIAISRGADIIEKHFAYDHFTGIDSPWSMNYDELKELREWFDLCEPCREQAITGKDFRGLIKE